MKNSLISARADQADYSKLHSHAAKAVNQVNLQCKWVKVVTDEDPRKVTTKKDPKVGKQVYVSHEMKNNCES